MRNIAKVSVLVAAVVVTFGAYRHVRAQEAAKPTMMNITGKRRAPVGLSGKHVLIESAFSQGLSGVALTGGTYTELDKEIKFNCKNKAGCTLAAEMNAEVGANFSALNKWAVCLQVDDKNLDTPLCPYQNYMQTDGSYTSGSFVQQASVAPGTHRVQTYLWADTTGAKAGIYDIVYRLYTP